MNKYLIPMGLIFYCCSVTALAQEKAPASIFKVTPASAPGVADGEIEIVLTDFESRTFEIRASKVLFNNPNSLTPINGGGTISGNKIRNLTNGKYVINIKETSDCVTCFIQETVEVGIREDSPNSPPCDPTIDPNCDQFPCDVTSGEPCDPPPPCDPATDPDCQEECSDCPCPPGDPNCYEVPIVVSNDPNDILGPEGYGPERWVPGNRPLHYKIRYENDPEFATAPAQNVLIDHTFNALIDAQSFELGDFGFGGYVFPIPVNQSYYKEIVDLNASSDLKVDFTGGVNVGQGSSFWRILSIDPTYGLPLEDAEAGYLPVNDLEGNGEGFVNFSVRPNASVETGDTIFAQANIVFDEQPPVITPVYFNKIDANAPVSEIVNATISTDSMIRLDLSVMDIGSGVAFYDLYASVDGGPFQLIRTSTPDITTFFYRGVIGRSTRFVTIAEDHVGNREQKDLDASATLVMEPKMIELLSPVDILSVCVEDILSIQWKATNSVNAVDIYLSYDNGTTYDLIAQAVPAIATEYMHPILPGANTTDNARIKVIDNQEAGIIGESPTFIITDDPSACAECDDITLTLNQDPLISKKYKASETIFSAGKISSDSYVIFQAGDRIELKPGFRVAAGASFLAEIKDCISTEETIPFIAQETTHSPSATLSVFPNPVRTSATIRFQLEESATVTVIVTDVMGRVVGVPVNNIRQETGSYDVPLSAENLNPGIYLVELLLDENQTLSEEKHYDVPGHLSARMVVIK